MGGHEEERQADGAHLEVTHVQQGPVKPERCSVRCAWQGGQGCVPT